MGQQTSWVFAANRKKKRFWKRERYRQCFGSTNICQADEKKAKKFHDSRILKHESISIPVFTIKVRLPKCCDDWILTIMIAMIMREDNHSIRLVYEDCISNNLHLGKVGTFRIAGPMRNDWWISKIKNRKNRKSSTIPDFIDSVRQQSIKLHYSILFAFFQK